MALSGHGLVHRTKLTLLTFDRISLFYSPQFKSGPFYLMSVLPLADIPLSPEIEKTPTSWFSCGSVMPEFVCGGQDVGVRGRRASGQPIPLRNDQAVALRRRRLPYPMGSLGHSFQYVGLPQCSRGGRVPA